MAKRKPIKIGRTTRIEHAIDGRIQRIKIGNRKLEQRVKGISQRLAETIMEMKKANPDMKKITRTKQLFEEYNGDAQMLLRHLKAIRKHAKELGIQEAKAWPKIEKRAKKTIETSNKVLEMLQKWKEQRAK